MWKEALCAVVVHVIQLHVTYAWIYCCPLFALFPKAWWELTAHLTCPCRVPMRACWVWQQCHLTLLGAPTCLLTISSKVCLGTLACFIRVRATVLATPAQSHPVASLLLEGFTWSTGWAAWFTRRAVTKFRGFQQPLSVDSHTTRCIYNIHIHIHRCSIKHAKKNKLTNIQLTLKN